MSRVKIKYPEKLAEGVYHTEESMIFDGSDPDVVVIEQLNSGGDVIYDSYVPRDVWRRLVDALEAKDCAVRAKIEGGEG